MNSPPFESTPKFSSKRFAISMATLSWGFAWFGMSVIIFVFGRLIPQVHRKPPPVLSPRSPRVRTISISPSPPHGQSKPLPPEHVDVDDACEPAQSYQRTSDSSEFFQDKRPSFKSRWSFTAPLRNAAPLSHKPPLISEVPSMPVGSSSPPCCPQLSVIQSASTPSDPPPSPPSPSPAGSPRYGRNVRLPSIKMFKTLSRRMSSKQRSSESSPSAPSASAVALDKKMQSLPGDEHQEQAQLGQLSQGMPGTHNGEVYTTTFVNPFRLKTRKPKTPQTRSKSSSAPASPSPSPRRLSGPRRVLTSLQLSLGSTTTPTSTFLDSPRSSLSSASTAVSTFAPSSFTAISGSSGSPRSVPRTQPYGAPYYAAMPIASGPSKRSSRRATSLSLDRPTVDTEDKVSILGLEFGQARSTEVQTEPIKRRTRHRAAASETVIQVVAGR